MMYYICIQLRVHLVYLGTIIEENKKKSRNNKGGKKTYIAFTSYIS